MGSPVQHIVRWSPQDWLTSRVRTRSIVTGKPMLRLIYREVLDALYEAGGAISADPVDLQDKIAVPLADIEECLPILLEIGQRGRGGLRVEHLDGLPVLVCRRVTEENEDDIAYRNTQSEHGKKGGRPRKATVTDERKTDVNQKATLSSEKGTLSAEKGTPSPPAPSPAPLPYPEKEKTPPSEVRPAPRNAAQPRRTSADDASPKKPPARYLSLDKGVSMLDRYPEIDTNEIREALREFLEVAEGEGKALSAPAITLQLKACREMGQARALVALRNSAQRRLPTVMEPFLERNGNGGGPSGINRRPADRHEAELLAEAQSQEIMRAGGDRREAARRNPGLFAAG